MEPAARLTDGTPLWLTGAVRIPEYNEYYWTPEGVKRRLTYIRCRAWPILTDKPLLPNPYLAGRIDECLQYTWNFGFQTDQARRLLAEARKHLWGR